MLLSQDGMNLLFLTIYNGQILLNMKKRYLKELTISDIMVAMIHQEQT